MEYGTHEPTVCRDTLMRNAGEDHVAHARLLLGEGQAFNFKTRLAAKLLAWAKAFLHLFANLQSATRNVKRGLRCQSLQFRFF